MKTIFLASVLIFSFSAFGEVMNLKLKLNEVNPDSTQARFFKGEPAYGLSDIFASVTCWGEDGNRISFEFGRTGKISSASFDSLSDCKGLIKLAKGFMGINYGTILFTIDTKLKRVLSYKRE